jgi:hypothetical protein
MLGVAGLVVLSGGLWVLWFFRVPSEESSGRVQGADVVLALVATTAIGIGTMMVGAGLIDLFY